MYLRCPDVCPIAMVRLGRLVTDLADLIPGRLRVVSLSVDHDAPSALHEMWLAHGSHTGWSMAALVDEPVAPTLQRLGVWMLRRRDGFINHGADLFLLDRRGDVVAVLSPDEDADAAEARIRNVMR
jgi:cytochrome oxidase Cu insertion factor (SCO1/SenC/PrrC family)